ncbi:hypothetical protein GW750_04060 [bacterium]|nr:hypothetical protein [bacterium]
MYSVLSLDDFESAASLIVKIFARRGRRDASTPNHGIIANGHDVAESTSKVLKKSLSHCSVLSNSLPLTIISAANHAADQAAALATHIHKLAIALIEAVAQADAAAHNAPHVATVTAIAAAITATILVHITTYCSVVSEILSHQTHK